MSDFMKTYWTKLRLGDGTEQTEIVKNRKQSLVENRKIKRETETFTRRKIPVDMSPYITPRPSKTIAKTTKQESPKNAKQDTRRELLVRWKTEKEKRRQQEKAKQKPVFKVCHITTSLKVELEDVNKVIKGKLIPSKKMASVPKKYKFEPPKGVKPVPHFTTIQKPTIKVSIIFVIGWLKLLNLKIIFQVTESLKVKPKISSNVKATTQATHQKQQNSQNKVLLKKCLTSKQHNMLKDVRQVLLGEQLTK